MAIDLHYQLIERCKKGNRPAQFELYSLYADAMLNTAFRILNDEEEAKDALQESFLSAFHQLHQFKHDSSFGAWLKRIVVNKSITALHRKKGRPIVSEIRDTPSNEEEATREFDATAEQAYAALHQLPDGYRTVFSLYLLEGYDHREIASILNISVSTSISQYGRAKKKLRTILLKDQPHGQHRATV